jgi:hypothetical protein
LPQAQVLGSSVICGAGYEAWEAGNIDYKGSDSFDLIQKAIEKTLSE